MPQRPRDFPVTLSPAKGQSLVRQIMGSLATAMRSGRLRGGQALPGSRQLAETLGVHRNTVLAALKELELEGWVESRPGSGTFVRTVLPEEIPRSWGAALPAGPAEPGFDLPAHLRPITQPLVVQIDLSEGLPDVREAPKEAMAKAYQRAIRLHGEELLGYGEPAGNLALRQALTELLVQRRGMTLVPDQVLVTRGSRMGLALVAQALLSEGGAVAVEDPGNPAAWDTLRQQPGVTLHPVPVDAEGLVPEALETLLAKAPVRLLHLTPRHHFPTTVALSPARRARVLEIAKRHRLAILEDDFDPEYPFEGSPRPALAAEDAEGLVIYMGSFSKVLAPGVRLGFLAAPRAFIERLARLRVRMDWQGDRVLEWAMADLWRDEDYARHVRRTRQLYRTRRDQFLALLREHLGERLQVDAPDGGLALWLGLEDAERTEAWVRAARTRFVNLPLPSHFDFQGRPLPRTRMGFAGLDEAQMRDAVKRLASVLPPPRRA